MAFHTFAYGLEEEERGGGGECVEMKKQKKKIQTNTVPLVAYVILVLCCES